MLTGRTELMIIIPEAAFKGFIQNSGQHFVLDDDNVTEDRISGTK
jgi:hypothetical protein